MTTLFVNLYFATLHTERLDDHQMAMVPRMDIRGVVPKGRNSSYAYNWSNGF
ncbi:MAG: hypothetical protein IPI30_04425 [Saprospiraceae bacterium]|nr:hypothetical protein [Candidatus Vicinibacter affinis]